MSAEQPHIDTTDLSPEVQTVLDDMGEQTVSFQKEDGETVSGSVREALDACSFLRELDGPTLRAVLSEVVATGTNEQ